MAWTSASSVTCRQRHTTLPGQPLQSREKSQFIGGIPAWQSRPDDIETASHYNSNAFPRAVKSQPRKSVLVFPDPLFRPKLRALQHKVAGTFRTTDTDPCRPTRL